MGVWIIIGFCTGMGGEEIVLIEYAWTWNILENMTVEGGFFKLVISDVTKWYQLSGSNFSFPCVNITRGLGLNPGNWIKCLIEIRNEEPSTGGSLFYWGTSRDKLHQYEADFFEMLLKVQTPSDYIGNNVDVIEVYGILKVSRRGSTTTEYAWNVKIDREVIEVVYRWRQEAFGSGVSLRLDLIDVYTSLDTLDHMLLGCSDAF